MPHIASGEPLRTKIGDVAGSGATSVPDLRAATAHIEASEREFMEIIDSLLWLERSPSLRGRSTEGRLP